MLRRRRRLIGALALALLTVAAGGDDTIPWPRDRPPTSEELDYLVGDALELFALERFDEYLEAFEKGEDSEHIHLFQEDVDSGIWDKGALFAFGDSLFEHEFGGQDGYGAEANATHLRVHDGARGGLDTFSCAGCHFVGGPDGAGTATQNTYFFGDGDSVDSAQIRNPPHVLGLGFVQAVAAEMSADLQLIRDDTITRAAETGDPVQVDLIARDVEFGHLVARPDGSVDLAGVEGVDPDLMIKPFGGKGRFATLRRTIEDAARVHFGIQSHVLALQWMEDPDPTLGEGPDW